MHEQGKVRTCIEFEADSGACDQSVPRRIVREPGITAVESVKFTW